VQAAISQQTKAAGICSDISPNTARPFCTEVKGEEITSFREIRVGVFKNDTSIKSKNARVRVEVSNRVQSLQRQDHFIEYRDASALGILASFGLKGDRPTSPVLPPWGTTAMFSLLQYFIISLICCTVLGRRTTVPCPRYLFIQSTL